MPPVRSGIAAYNAELLPHLTRDLEIDIFDRPRAHDFVWRHFSRPYDLTVYQLGNATCHDYMWPYLVRYPGLTVLHDRQLHQSRAAALLTRHRRADDYRAEFAFSHPDAPPAVAELIIQGHGGELLHFWPLDGVVVRTSRSVAVHNPHVADELRDRFSTRAVEVIPMGVASHAPTTSAERIRKRLGVSADERLVAAFGRVTPEKRISPILRAMAALNTEAPGLRLVLVGEAAEYYDAMEEARLLGVGNRVVRTGYVEDAELADYIEAADFCLCLRWPSAGESSASWLRCLAAGKATVITDLTHLALVPTIDPRTWEPLANGRADPPIAVSIDILDEDHSLKLALRRLARDEALRTDLGRRAREYWARHHTLELMADSYRRAIAATLARPAPNVNLPPHLTVDGTELAKKIAGDFGISLEF
jgi:glycosyltransferase involved in cell wall biosynthesis